MKRYLCPRCGTTIGPWQVYCGPCGPAVLAERKRKRATESNGLGPQEGK